MSNEVQADTNNLQTQTSTNAAQATAPRMRRFQRAMPNLAVSSGLERIRRLSGHYASNISSLETNDLTSGHHHHPHHLLHHPAPLSPLVTQSTQLIENVLSPKVNTHSPVKSVDLQTTTTITLTPTKETFKGSLLNKHEENVRKLAASLTSTTSCSIVSIPSSPMEPQTPTLFQNTPCGSVYNPKFSSEQIMNTIKLRAMLKLKKIESESLREKRKKYKKELNEINKLIDLNKEEDSMTSSLDSNASNASNILRVDRSKMKMRDLLYYNPKSNKKAEKTPSQQLTPSKKKLQSEQTDESRVQTLSPTLSMAPQLKIAEDGSVVINEESLFIREKEAVYEETIIENENNDGLTYNSYRKFHHTKKWSRKETAKFYKALSMVGTDFTMIQRLFSYRNRDEIKRKFKREEKINQALIDKILSKTSQVDLSVFLSSGSEDNDGRNDQNENESSKRGKKRLRKKQQVENGSTASGAENLTPDQTLSQNEKRKKEKLKRVKKREFIESESEDEQNRINKEPLNSKTANTEMASKQSTTSISHISTSTSKLFASPETDKSASSQLVMQPTLTFLPPCSTLIYSSTSSPMSSSSASSIISSFVSPVSDKSKLVLNDQIYYNNQEEEIEEEADGEGIELIFDMDNNLVEEIIQSPNVHSKSHPQQQLQHQSSRADSSQTNIPISSIAITDNQSSNEEDEHVIFDLDNNQVIKNTEVIDMNSIEYSIANTNESSKSDVNVDRSQQQQQQQQTHQDDEQKTSSSCITITRLNSNKNNSALN